MANINNNHISFCKYGVFINNPDQLANKQFTGNDVELNTYPLEDKSDDQAIYVYSDDFKALQMSKIEICDNTIQGHELSETTIEITGGIRNIEHTSIVGNHISNILPNGKLVVFVKYRNMTICGNTFKDELKETSQTTQCISISGSSEIAIVGNSFIKVRDFATITNNFANISIGANARNCTRTFAYSDNTCDNIIQNGSAVVDSST